MTKLSRGITMMLGLYKDMRGPTDIWKNQAYLQGIRDCLQALVVSGILKDYHLVDGTFTYKEM